MEDMNEENFEFDIIEIGERKDENVSKEDSQNLEDINSQTCVNSVKENYIVVQFPTENNHMAVIHKNWMPTRDNLQKAQKKCKKLHSEKDFEINNSEQENRSELKGKIPPLYTSEAAPPLKKENAPLPLFEPHLLGFEMDQNTPPWAKHLIKGITDLHQDFTELRNDVKKTEIKILQKVRSMKSVGRTESNDEEGDSFLARFPLTSESEFREVNTLIRESEENRRILINYLSARGGSDSSEIRHNCMTALFSTSLLPQLEWSVQLEDNSKRRKINFKKGVMLKNSEFEKVIRESVLKATDSNICVNVESSSDDSE